MDQQRPFLYLTLFFLGFLIWTTWQEDHAPKPVKPAGQIELNSANSNSSNNGNSMPSGSSISTGAAVNNGGAVPVGNSVENNDVQQIHIKTDVLDLIISTQGGTVVQADLPTHPVSLEEQDKATRIIDKEQKYAAQSGLIYRGTDGSNLAPNHFANFSAPNTEYILQEGQNTLQVPLTWSNGNGLTVTKNFVFERGSFLVKQIQKVDNQTGNTWSGNEYLELTHKKHSRKGSLLGGAIAYVGPAYYKNKYQKIDFGDIEDGDLKDLTAAELNALSDEEKEERLIKGGWVAMLKHYFVSAWVPVKENENTYYTRIDKTKNNYIIGVKSPVMQIDTGASGEFISQLYVGPTDQASLAEISKGLDLTVDYGIFAFVSKPIFAVMSFINRNIVSNWGWTIILLTLFIKMIFFYPSAMSYKSMAKMKKFQPQIKALGEKYKGDPQGKQKATMTLFKKEKINPLGGCLPMLIQMPVFMGLYWVIQESVELRQAPWMLWYQDLSIMDPYFVLPLIMGASMWLQQKLNPPAMQDPMQQKIFMYLPIVFTVMFLFFPAGLVLYWVVNSILSIAQQWFINKKIIGDSLK